MRSENEACELAQFFGEDLRLFEGGEVAAVLGLVPVDEIVVRALSPDLGCGKDVLGGDGDADRQVEFMADEG
ncbi:hypothetical protein ACFRDV_39140 [Streptomyces fagopyri]|uniref:hypothetical protein n=1 Tax=Streptomyces fagopyri TaxID=2662397 RepID=UPI0036B8AA7D